MPMSKCSDVIERVHSVIDGEATTWNRMRFFMHLGMCSKCRRYYQQMKGVVESSGEVTQEDLPDDFENVMNFVLDEVQAPKDDQES